MSAALACEQEALLHALWARSLAKGQAAVAPWIQAAGAQRGLQCHRANGLALAERALGAAYPVLRQLVGGDSFAAMAADFWHGQPPRRGDMAQWGDTLPGWVRAANSLADVPYLADLAEVEWALHRMAIAPDDVPEPDSFRLLIQVDPAALRMHLAPTAQCLPSPWPVVSLMQAHLVGQPTLDEVGRRLRDHAACATPVAECALVWRQGWCPRLREAMPGEPGFLAALQGGSSLAQALQSHPSLDFAQWLPIAVHSALLVRVQRLDLPGVHLCP